MGGMTNADEPRWLSRDELAAWLANSALMISLPAALDARMQRESQLTFFEYMVLSVLSEEPEHTLQMSDLAARTSASLSRLSHVVGRLEKRELLRRARIPGSGRRTAATLTGAGHQIVVAAAPGHVAAVREYLIDNLDADDLTALRRIGTAVQKAISD
jgi:DNA-binding MarR family transcriptional regulator